MNDMRMTRPSGAIDVYKVYSRDLSRAATWLTGQRDRRNGLPCRENNGTYLDGWYARDVEVPPMLTEAEYLEALRQGILTANVRR